MGIKGVGGPGFQPINLVKKSKKTQGTGGFDKVLNTPAASPKKDSVELSGFIPDNKGSNYSDLKSVKETKSLDPIIEQVLSQPEEMSSRVQEIKDIISKGGYKAYFDSIDKDKLADKLLNSGNFDDLI